MEQVVYRPIRILSAQASAQPLIYNWKITDKNASVYEMQRCLKEFHEIRPYYYEDYYPLTGTEDMTRDNIWLAYQMHRPSDDSGIIVAFRRTASKDKKNHRQTFRSGSGKILYSDRHG